MMPRLRSGMRLPLIFSIALLTLQSCASLTRSRVVTIESETPGATIYVNNQEYEKPIKLEPEDIVIGAVAPRHRKLNIPVTANKLNPMFLANFWAFALFPVAFADDAEQSDAFLAAGIVSGVFVIIEAAKGMKVKKHAHSYTIPALEPLPTNPSKDLFFFIDPASIDLAENHVIYETFKDEDALQKGKGAIVKQSPEKLLLKLRSGIDEQVDVIFDESGFINSDDEFTPSYSKVLRLSYNVEEVRMRWVGSFNSGILKIKWMVRDYYGKELLSTYTEAASNVFRNASVSDVLDDALEAGIVDFVKNNELQRILSSHKDFAFDTRSRWEDIILPKTTASGAGMGDYTQSAVTVVNGLGQHCSGTILSEDGYILTAMSSFEKLFDLKVIMHDGSELPAEIVREDPEYGIMLIRVETGSARLSTLAMNLNGDIPLGEEIYLIGTPTEIELGQTVSKGIVSAAREVDGKSLIQTDVAANVGSNGGPLLSKSGEVFGILDYRSYMNSNEGIEGISFGYPMKTVFERLKMSLK